MRGVHENEENELHQSTHTKTLMVLVEEADVQMDLALGRMIPDWRELLQQQCSVAVAVAVSMPRIGQRWLSALLPVAAW